MQLNLLIVLVMYFPFFIALMYKYTSVISKAVLFVWCAACSSLMILCVEVANQFYIEHGEYGYKIIITIVGWVLVDMYLGIKVVLSDAPRGEIPK